MTLREKIKASLKEDENIFDSETMEVADIREMAAKGLHPVCCRCGSRLEFALSPSEARTKGIAPGLRCPKSLTHCQIVVEFPREHQPGR